MTHIRFGRRAGEERFIGYLTLGASVLARSSKRLPYGCGIKTYMNFHAPNRSTSFRMAISLVTSATNTTQSPDPVS